MSLSFSCESARIVISFPGPFDSRETGNLLRVHARDEGKKERESGGKPPAITSGKEGEGDP